MSFLLAALLAAAPSHAWGHHYLVTDRALEHPTTVDWVDAPVTVESLDRLLDADSDALARAVDDHYAWLLSRGSDRFDRQILPREDASRAAFIRACRMNPDARFPLVLRVLPDGPRHGFPIAPESATPWLHAVGPLLAEVEVVAEGAQVPASAVLATFADEPDWGFDHALWDIPAYAFGEQPFGKAQGESSKAPFHMQFDHENVLTRMATDLDEAMVPDRVDLFLRLSRAAFQTGHDYWGLRFAAWATHYAQDLAQPYHSRAVPGARFGWYLRYLLSGDKDRIETETTQLAANRHFVYEDFVAYSLQQSYSGADGDAGALAAFLRDGPAVLQDGRQSLGAGSSAQALVDALTRPAAKHAHTIDVTLRSAFPPALMEDPAYDVETAPDYAIADLLPQVPAAAAADLLAETGKDFSQAGAATRTVLVMVGAREALVD